MAREISLADASYGTTLLERLCLDYLDMNVYLPPCFHYALHIEDTITDFGSLNNTWVWSFEHAHQTLIRAHKNGHTNGILERTMMRKWLRMQSVQMLVSNTSQNGSSISTYVCAID
jgi:hypothetical protein